MSDMKAATSESTELRKCLHGTTLSHMASSQKDAKGIYFSMFGYDINVYRKNEMSWPKRRIVQVSLMMQTRTVTATYGEFKRTTIAYSKCRNIWTVY